MMTPLTDNDRPYRGRRLSWAEFDKLRQPAPEPDNDNRKEVRDHADK